MKTIDLGAHLVRIALTVAVIAVVPIELVPPASIGLFLAAFALNHDLVHGALGLRRRWSELLITLAGALMLTSGHAIKKTHLIHHRRTFAEDDLEGMSARFGFFEALSISPILAYRCRFDPLRGKNKVERRLQIAEHALSALAIVLIVVSRSPTLIAFAATAIVLQTFLPLWAGHIPHRAPKEMIELARKLAFTRSPTILSLAFHDLHHANPSIPCRKLGMSPNASVAR
jgi:fatty acid desaturase